MQYILQKIQAERDLSYKIYKIKKNNGKFRRITAPSENLKKIQRNFLKVFGPILDKDIHKSAKGFRKGLSIIDNARPHLNKKVVVNIDIKDFFPSIPTVWLRGFCEDIAGSPRMKKFMKRHKLGDDAAEAIFEILTLNGGLPQGSPCSPMIANYYLSNVSFDLKMSLISFWDYTRYADDLTFSTNTQNTKECINALIGYVYRELKREGLKPNKEKTVIKANNQKQLVTGILVNGGIPKVPKKCSNRIRAAIYKNGMNEETKGFLSYVKSVNKEQFNKLTKIGDK